MTIQELNAVIATPPPPTEKSSSGGAAMQASQMMLNVIHGVGQYAQGVGSAVSNDIQQAGSAVNADITGQGNAVERGFEAAGAGAGAVANVATDVLPSGLRQGAKDVMNSPNTIVDWLGQKLGDTKVAQDFVTKYPEAANALQSAATIGANAGSVAGTILGAKGVTSIGDAAVKAAPNIVANAGKVASTVGGATGSVATDIASKVKAAASAGKEVISGKEIDPTESDLMPRLTAKAAEEAKKSDPQGLTGKIRALPDESVKKMAKTVKQTVPGFDDMKTYTEKANAVRKARNSEAQNLKQDIAQHDHPVPKRELKSQISNVEIPELIKTGDAAVRRMSRALINKAKTIIDDQGGTVSGSLEGRKAFDDYIEKEIPNLYDNQNITAYRQLVSSIRSTWNKSIADALPKNVDYLGSLNKQSDLFDAEDVLNEKAARGAPESQGEIGSNRFGRYAKAHPHQMHIAEGLGTVIGGGEIAKQLGIIP